MKFQQFLRVIAARWWVVVLVFGAMVGATAAITALLPKQYTATTTMVIEPRGADALGTLNMGAQMLAQTYMATQIDVLQSERVGREVVRALGIDRSAGAIRQWREATQGNGSVEAYYADLLAKKLEIKPSRESSVVALSFTGTDPQFAAQVVDAYAQAYIATSLQLRNNPSKLYATWFDEQLKSLRAELEQAQARVSAFQQRNGIVANDERLDVENARLAELSQQLVLAQSQSVDARSRSQTSSASVRSIPEVGSTAVVQNLRTELLRAETRVQEAGEQYGRAHPTLERMQAELASLRERLQAELGNANGSIATVSAVFDRREAGLRDAVAAQKQRVLQIKQQRDEMSTLQREAENAQRVFDVALQRLAQTRLESQNTQTNAYVLNTASIPGEPSSPKVQRNLLLSGLLGLLLGLASAFLVELVDRRIRSADDLEGGLKLPVLGQLPRTLSRVGTTRPPLGWRGAPAATQGSSMKFPNLKIAPSDDGTTIDMPGQAAQPVETPAAQPAPQVPAGNRLGSILVELGRIEGRQVDAVLAAQQAQNPKRFGELAIALGLVVRADIDLALARQFDVDFVPADDDDAVVLPNRMGDVQNEVLRAVRSQLMLRWFGNEPEQRTLAVVSHGAGEGRSHVCAHLAMQLAQMDEDTLVIDADLRKPSMHTFFGVDNKTGLADYLARDVTRAPIRAVRGKPRLHLLSAGALRPDAQALLERRQFGLLLGTLAQRYAFVLIDTPPAAQYSEALTAAVRASGCLLVTRRNRTRVADAQRLADQLTRHSVDVLGAVINER